MSNSIAENISKNLRRRYSPDMLTARQKLLDHPKNLQQIDLKLLQNDSFKKTAEATGDLTGNKIANKITKLSKN